MPCAVFQKRKNAMLVLSRQRGQSIRIGEDVTVTVTELRGDKVRLGVSAPDDVKVFRSEIYEQVKQSNVESSGLKPKDLENLPPKDQLAEPIGLSGTVDANENQEPQASDRKQLDMSSLLMTETKRGVYLAYNCVVTGDVKVGEGSSLWFGAVVRGDVAPVVLGKRVNVQDNAVVHCDSGVMTWSLATGRLCMERPWETARSLAWGRWCSAEAKLAGSVWWLLGRWFRRGLRCQTAWW
jgi:carbon storage regulator